MATQAALTREECGYFEDKDGTIKIEGLVINPARPPTLSYDAPESRLMITELIIENFKSYYGKQTLGPFNKNFTSIVGPNGSGKSNVIDSLLFVFGYKARKIRSKKLSLLIHNSTQHQNLTKCSVTVNFAVIRDEGEGYSVVPDSRFILSRTAFSDDTSYYEIMHSRAKYKEVTQTLKAYGIDLEHSRFLILQGEIEAISLLQPKALTEHDPGMLEYIEDIIGSNRFIEPIKIFTEKVNTLNEEKKLKVNELKIFESEKDKLEGPKNQAIQYLRLENQTFVIENSILHLKRKEAEHELQAVSEKKKDLVSTMRDVKKQMDDLADSKHSIQKEIEKVTHDLENSHKNFEKYKEEFKKQECTDASLAEEFKYAKTKKSNLQDSLAKLQTELSKLEKQLNIYESETKELEVLLKKLEAEKEIEDKKASEVMGSLQKETNALKEKKDKFDNQLVKSKEIVNEIRSEINLLTSERDIYTCTEKKEKEKLSSLVSDLEKNTTVTAAEEKLMKTDEGYIAKLESDLESLKNQLQDSQSEEQHLSQELKLKRIKLEEAKSSVTSTQSRNQMINAFRKEKAQGRFTGVYGRLGDLGAIDQKYDVAISTACGPLDNIVTDSMNTAQKCVEFLKKNNLGYTTFLPLDKMEKWSVYVNKKIQTPENVPRLFDLITVNDKAILPAFYYALRDTLVADTLEQATRIGLQGKHRFRVVTLRGDLIDLAGTMSGGGARMMRGRMGQKIVECTTSDADVADMKSEIDALTKKMSEIKKLCLNLENQIYEKNKILVTAQRNAKKRIANVASYKEAIEMLKSQIEDQKIKIANTRVDHTKVESLNKQIAQKTKDHEEAVEKSSAIEKTVSSIRDEILSISKGKSKNAQKCLLQLEKQLQEKTQAMTKSTVNIKSSKRNIDKTKKKIASTEKEIEDLINSLTCVKEKRKELEDQARETHEKQLEAENQIAEFKEKKVNLKKGIEEINEKEHQLKLLDIERKNELKNLEALESEKKSEIKAINAKLTKLKLNEVENDPTDIPTLTADDISKLSKSKLYSDLDVLKLQMEDLKPNFSAIKEFRIKERQFLEKQSLVDDINRQINIENFRLTELQNKRLSDFNTGFAIIAQKLKEIYQMLTLGGDAEIQPLKMGDPFAEGIQFNVRPPKKAWKNMRNLSGGEKTLSSLSLVFALHYYRPTPFYVMDEIDAALDFRNVAIIAYYLKKQTKNAQLVVVSLRNVMNELSDQLLGIFKIDNCTKFLNLTNVASWAEEEEDTQRTSAQNV